MRPPRKPEELLGRPFTRSQARSAGLTAAELRSSAWRRILHDVYVSADIDDSFALRAAAVQLVLPDDAVVGYASAAWLRGADVRRSLKDLAVDVVAQRGDQIRRAGIRATSALLEPGDVVVCHGVPMTSATRTAFDLARRRDLIEAVVGVDAMLNRGGCELDELVTYVQQHRGW